MVVVCGDFLYSQPQKSITFRTSNTPPAFRIVRFHYRPLFFNFQTYLHGSLTTFTDMPMIAFSSKDAQIVSDINVT